MARKLSEREALLASVYEAPDDDAPRLVYADWLDEHGDAQDQDRAAFIRAGCRAARAPFDSAERVSAEVQSAVLFQRHNKNNRDNWAKELPATLRKRFVRFARGFPFGITTKAALLARSANTLCQRTAVQEVNLEGMSQQSVGRLSGLPLLGRLRSLVGGNVDAAGVWSTLLADPALHDLERFSLKAYLGGHQAGLARLLELPSVRGVRALDYESFHSSTDGEPRRRTLELLAAAEFPRLRSLRYNLLSPLSEVELRALLGAPLLARLEELHLDCGLTSRTLAGARCLERLRALTVLTSEQDAPQLAAALSGWRFPNLSWLQFNRADDQAVRHLAECPFAANLRVLDLFAHRLTAGGMAALASGRFAKLVWLGLWNGSGGEEHFRALASSPGLPELRYLDLHGPRLTQDCLDALADSPHLPRLEAVAVGAYAPEPFPPEWVARYAHRFVVLPPPLGFLSSR